MSEHDDRLDDAELALAGRLSTLLAERAAALVVADEVFDPTRPSGLASAAGPGAVPSEASLTPVAPKGGGSDGRDGRGASALEPLPIDRSGRAARRWITWVAGAAAAAVLIAAIVMVNAVRQPTVDVGEDPAPPLVAPDDVWAPAWVPDGLQLWTIDLTRSELIPYPPAADATSPRPPTIEQLVTSSDGTRLLLSGGGSADFKVSGGPKTPVTVRGTEGWTRSLLSPVSGTQLGWSEGGVDFVVRVGGTDVGSAIAVLDRLVPLDGADLGAGLTAPDGSATVVTDRQGSGVDVWPTTASFGYSSSQPSDQELGLTVGTQGPTAGPGPMTAGVRTYLSVGFEGEIRPDGMAFAYRDAVENRGRGLGQAVWPDGRSVFVGGDDLDAETALRVATEVRPITAAGLGQLMDEVSDRLGAGPVLARADLPSGTVEVVGEPGPVALCLTVDSRRRCSLSDRLAGAGDRGPGPAQLGSRSWLIDGRWYLVGTNEGPVNITVELGGGASGTPTGTGPPDPDVQAEKAGSGAWTVGLLVVPDEWEMARIDLGDRSLTLSRPTT